MFACLPLFLHAFYFAGLQSETQGWWLRRCLSFTHNRLVSRPNQPKCKTLRKFLEDIGVKWEVEQPEQEPDQSTDEDEDLEDEPEEEWGEEEEGDGDWEGGESEQEAYEEDPEIEAAHGGGSKEVPVDESAKDAAEVKLDDGGKMGDVGKPAAETACELKDLGGGVREKPCDGSGGTGKLVAANNPASPSNPGSPLIVTPPPKAVEFPTFTPEAVASWRHRNLSMCAHMYTELCMHA